MTTKKTTPSSKPDTKKSANTTTAPNSASPATASSATAQRKKPADAHEADLTQGKNSRQRDGTNRSDVASDERLRHELEKDAGRNPADRHREGLTAVEAEEDGVREDDEDAIQDDITAADK